MRFSHLLFIILIHRSVLGAIFRYAGTIQIAVKNQMPTVRCCSWYSDSDISVHLLLTEVCSQLLSVNLALNKNALQSSTYAYTGTYNASSAVDGVLASYSNTGLDPPTTDPWWYADLGNGNGDIFTSLTVTIYNRQDCCAGEFHECGDA